MSFLINHKNNFASNVRYLMFTLGESYYAIPLLSVKEVIAMPEITPVPFTPNYFLGIMNLRGQVMTLLDFRIKLGITPKKSQETSVILCDFDQICLGVVVDSVDSVISPSEESLSERPDFEGKNMDFITKVYRNKESLVLILDMTKALGIETIQNAVKIQKATT